MTSEYGLLLESLSRNRNVDTKKMHKRAAELTRQKLLLAAIESFSTKGFHNSNIRDIAQEADVTKGAFYHHFKDKKDLFASANLWRQGYTSEVLRKAMSEESDFFNGLKKGLCELFQILHADPMIRGLVREYMAMAMIDQDFNEMYRQNDAELFNLMQTELTRHYPDFSAKRRALLLQKLYVSLEGLFTVLVVGSPIVTRPEQMLENLIETFRKEIAE